MSFQKLVNDTRRREFYGLDNTVQHDVPTKSDATQASRLEMHQFENMNVHLKNNSQEAFHVNDKILNYSMPDLKFDKMSKEKFANDTRYLKKSKFSWQLNEFNW